MRKSLKLLGKPCCRGVLVGVHLGVVELSRKAARRNVDLFPVASQKIDLQSMKEIKIGQETNLQGWAKEWTLGCVNPASKLPLAAGGELTQPGAYSFAQPCTIFCPHA